MYNKDIINGGVVVGKAVDLTGLKFNRLTGIKRYGIDNHGKVLWVFECECGKNVILNGSRVKNGNIKSCGCIQFKHGLSSHRTYGIFTQMKHRCFNREHISYPWYGAKGVKIHQEWLDDFSKFYEWSMENGYDDNLEIDRIDSSGNYEPNNCKWSTRTEQNTNQALRKDNKSGCKGVTELKNGTWYARINVNKVPYNLGYYKTKEEAIKARKDAEIKLSNSDMV